MNHKRHRIFYGWWIVASCIPVALFTNGVIGLGFTAVFEPLAEEFGWSYAQVSIGASLRGMQASLFAPLTGYLADRWGPRIILFAGTIICGLGMVLLSLVDSLSMFYGAFVIIAIGMSCCNQTILMTAVVNWFKKNVTKAIGITAAGISLSGLMIGLVTILVDTLDWRTAMLLLGLIMWILIAPITLFIRHKPEQYDYLPDGEVAADAVALQESQTVQKTDVEIPAGQALRSRTFWQLAIAFLCFTMMTNAFITHIMPYFSTVGIARSISSLIASGGPVIGIIGSLGIGCLGDRIDKRYAAAICFSLVVVGLLSLAYVTIEEMWILIPHLIFFHIGVGSVIVMRPALLREYFGRSRFGLIMGLTNGIAMTGGIAGPFLAGWTFDSLGTYRPIWIVLAGLAAVSLLLIFYIRPLLNPEAANNN